MRDHQQHISCLPCHQPPSCAFLAHGVVRSARSDAGYTFNSPSWDSPGQRGESTGVERLDVDASMGGILAERLLCVILPLHWPGWRGGGGGRRGK